MPVICFATSAGGTHLWIFASAWAFEPAAHRGSAARGCATAGVIAASAQQIAGEGLSDNECRQFTVREIVSGSEEAQRIETETQSSWEIQREGRKVIYLR
ncbi:Coronin [Mesorhizobium loti]|nr:Coronin [Mesorhizobium loti]